MAQDERADYTVIPGLPLHLNDRLLQWSRILKRLHAGIAGTPHTFLANDATPSVAAGKVFVTANTGATTITAFDDGTDGQEITVLVDGNTTVQDSATIQLAGGVNFVGSVNDVIGLVRIAGVWYERSRSVN